MGDMGLKIYHNISGIYCDNDINDDNSGNPVSLEKSIIFPIFTQNRVLWALLSTRACEPSGERSVRNIAGARSGFLSKGRSDRSLAPVPLRYRSHHEPRACTNPPRIHLCLQQLTKLSAYTSKIIRCEGEIWSSWNISKSKPTGNTGAQFLSKK